MDDEELGERVAITCADLFANHPDQGSVVLEALLHAVCIHITITSEDIALYKENFQTAHDILNEREEQNTKLPELTH